MSGPFQIFLIFAALLLAQSAVSLRDGFRYLRYLRRSRSWPPGDFAPRAALIIPVKGIPQDLEVNVAAFLQQDYPRYDLTFVVEDQRDPAFSRLNTLVAKTREPRTQQPLQAAVAVAGISKIRGQKVHNLLEGLKTLDPAAEVLVFADVDARPGPSWLKSLVAPLADQEVTVSTGFRWYLPGQSFASRLRAAWDTSIATVLGEQDSPFAWGGSMALRVQEFKRLRVAEDYWQSTVSDDYSLSRAVHDAGGRIRFEPRSLVLSREDSTFRELLRWTNRQIIITRVYSPRLWRLGLAAHALYAGTLIFGLALFAGPWTRGPEKLIIAASLAAILALGMAKGKIRSIVAREVFPEESRKYGNCYWQFAPLVPWVMVWNFLAAAFTRCIEWQGTRYRLKSDHEVEIVGRGAG